MDHMVTGFGTADCEWEFAERYLLYRTALFGIPLQERRELRWDSDWLRHVPPVSDLSARGDVGSSRRQDRGIEFKSVWAFDRGIPFLGKGLAVHDA